MQALKSVLRKASRHWGRWNVCPYFKNRSTKCGKNLSCCRLNVYVPPDASAFPRGPSVMVFGSRGVFQRWSGQSLHEGDPALIQAIPQSSLAASRGQWEDCPWSRRWILTKHQICRVSDLGLFRLWAMRNQVCASWHQSEQLRLLWRQMGSPTLRVPLSSLLALLSF